MSLSNIIAQRLRAAGIAPNDPGLMFIRDWNAAAYARAAAVEEARRAAALAKWRAGLQEPGQ